MTMKITVIPVEIFEEKVEGHCHSYLLFTNMVDASDAVQIILLSAIDLSSITTNIFYIYIVLKK